ncbi:tetratricopeptide repeat protein [Cognatilysobacter bugurensis]|nr:tetratricopeptide repeat protein [Lysobacter bugurensis]
MTEVPARRLGAALVAALALGGCNRAEPEPTAAVADAGRPARTLDRVLVRPPGAAVVEPSDSPDAAVDAAIAGDTRASEEWAVVPDDEAPESVGTLPPGQAERAPSQARSVQREPGAVERSGDDLAAAARRERPPAVHDGGAAPQHARRLNQQAIELINAGRPEQAIEPLERALAQQPRDAEMLGNLGYAYMLLGEHTRASQHLTRSLDVAPTRSATWLNLGQTYAELGERERAVDAVLTGYRHASRKDAVRSALMAAATGRRYSPAWREAAGIALVRIGDG